MLFILRHGERGDYGGPEEQKLVELSYDPHLTELGKIQARKAGDKLVQLIKEHKEYESKTEDLKYLIISSPFRRCIQTAFHVSQALPKDKIIGETIYMNEFLSEYLAELYLYKDVLNDLQIRTNPDEVHKQVELKLQDGYPNIGDHASTPVFPERSDGIRKRLAEGYHKVRSHYLNEVNKDGNVVIILVTHAYVVECFLEQCGNYDVTKGVEYTCLSQIVFDAETGKEKIVVGQCHEQLKDADDEYKRRTAHTHTS